MTENRRNKLEIGNEGFGTIGYCSLCQAEIKDPGLAEGFAARFKGGWSAAQLAAWIEKRIGRKFDKATIYKHRKNHIAHPADRVVTAVQKRQQQGLLPMLTSGEDLTAAVISAAYERLIEDPTAITVSQGLRAASIQATSKVRESDVIKQLVVIVGQDRVIPQLREPAIEAEFAEIEE